LSAKHVIRLGDPTTHGGTVVSASTNSSMFGKEVACMGDKVTCPIRGHGVCTIVEGDPTYCIDGRPVALEGHKTSCGASLISTLSNVVRSPEGSGAASAGVGGAAAAVAAAGAAAAAVGASSRSSGSGSERYDDRFQLLDENTEQPLLNTEYAIVRASGEVEHGTTDDQGLTHLLSSTEASESVAIYI